MPTHIAIECAGCDAAKREKLAQRLQQQEIQTAIHASGVGALQRGGFHNFAQRHAVGLGGAGCGAKHAPKGVRRPVGIIQPKTVNALRQPTASVFDHVIAGGRCVAVNLRQLTHPKKAQVFVRPVQPGKPGGFGRIGLGERRLKHRMFV